MEIVNSLKSRIGKAELDKIAEFLGESNEDVNDALNLSLNSMLGGLKGITKRDGDASGILKVINDGGHSGDLTDNLGSLFGNADKMQLLITIGKNINNHFFQTGVDSLVDKIATEGVISKTSASSLFSLAAPLVLGVLGKNIRLDGLNTAGFTSKLLGEAMNLPESTSLELMNSLGFSGSSLKPVLVPETEQETEVESYEETNVSSEPKIERRKMNGNVNTLNWLAWVLLGLLGLAVAYYTFKDKYLKESQSEVAVPTVDSSRVDSDEDIFESLDTDRNKNSKENTTDNSPSPEPEKTKEPSVEKVVTESPKVIEKTELKTQTSVVRENVEANNVAKDTRPMSVKFRTSGTFFGINGLSFKRNSAEIISRGSLNELVTYLKNNPSKSIQIAGTESSTSQAEDRAYGLQGSLYEAGIEISRLQVLNNAVSGDGPVVVKIK